MTEPDRKYRPSRLSYSSVSTYIECPARWHAEKVLKVALPTWWATVAGSAVHTITEAADRRLFDPDHEVPTWEQAFTAEIEDQAGREIKASGRILQKLGKSGGPNKKDKAWWDHFGPLMVQSWIDWRDARFDEGWRIATLPTGERGIEITLDFTLGGGRAIAIIDRLMLDPDDALAVVDLKSGAVPESTLQLATYEVGIRRTYGVEPDRSFYWMAGKGEPTQDAFHPAFTNEYVDDLFASVWRGIDADLFPPCNGKRCSWCADKPRWSAPVATIGDLIIVN